MKKTLFIHPFLFAVLPVRFLFSHNIEHLELPVIFMPIVISLAFALILLLKELAGDLDQMG